MTVINGYDDLLSTLARDQWLKVGVKKRAGVAVPLFSIYSTKSIGIGEYPDLKILIDWCRSVGISIIQLLPMNDVGFNFRPYDAQSMFALEPMYLSLTTLAGIDSKIFTKDLKILKNAFPVCKQRIDYGVKAAKLKLLWKIFESGDFENNALFKSFSQNNAYWLEDYALFKVIKEKNNEMAWEGWSEDLKYKNQETIFSFQEKYRENIVFHKWLQWQAFEQFIQIKKYAQAKSVFLMGDLPFLVSRDSADVWSHQEYFKLSLSSGAPPDLLYSSGQRWGMPPYNWGNIEKNNYDYVIEKLRYAQNFYDLYRIDHVVGIFRVWTISLSEPMEHSGLHGKFDPEDGNLWEDHGRKLLSLMIKNSPMLACAEDLGTIPNCCTKILDELGIPGIDVQRWMRHWGKTCDFMKPQEYRNNSTVTIATHDMSSLCAWWEFEAGTIEEGLFKRKCSEKNINFEACRIQLFDLEKSCHGRLLWNKEINSIEALLGILKTDEFNAKDIIDLYQGSFNEKKQFLEFIGIDRPSTEKCDPLFIKAVLEKINSCASIFSIQLLHDYLSLDALFKSDSWELRINFPGTLNDKNWTLCMPISLEDMLSLPFNKTIRSICEQSHRI